MARAATGQLVERVRADGSRVYGLRFRAYGARHRLTLGTDAEGWDPGRAQTELENLLADVRRGIWRPPAREPTEAPRDPTFHEFASDWIEAVAPALASKTVNRYRWQLTHHLLPVFSRHRLSEITIAEVDRYRETKARARRAGEARVSRLEELLAAREKNGEPTDTVAAELRTARRERGLSLGEVNATLTRLGQILDVADERELIDRNPLRVNPKRRKLKAPKPRSVWLDRAEQIGALLEAAAELDREARDDRRHVGRRAIIATLVFGGLRIEEACRLRWRDVDLAGRRLRISESKTDAGRRDVDLLDPLRDALIAHKLNAAHPSPSGYVFATRDGGAPCDNHLRARVFNAAVKRASELLERDDLVPLPEGLTPHKLRHTFASLLFALGRDPVCVMGQLGHTDPGFTLRIYAHAMRRESGDLDSLKALVEGADWATMGHNAPSEASGSPAPAPLAEADPASRAG